MLSATILPLLREIGTGVQLRDLGYSLLHAPFALEAHHPC